MIQFSGSREAIHAHGACLFTVDRGMALCQANAGDGNVKFVGSRDSDVYHYPNCSDVKKIKPENLVQYSSAPEGKRLHRGCPR